MKSIASWLCLVVIISACAYARSALVIQTDFGLKDGAVAAMKGVAFGVDSNLPIFDLSHENTPYDIWQGAYRLKQTAPYWPAGTVFVSVIDPGVGTERKSVVLKTKNGQYFVGPDNGTFTHIAEDLGIEAVREIDERRNRLPGSEKSYTFHGRDIFAYTGARLASGKMTFEAVGPQLPANVVMLPYAHPQNNQGVLSGSIALLDIQYGNVWTNIPDALWGELKPKYGDRFAVELSRNQTPVYRGELPFVRTFGDVPEGSPLLYLNSLLNLSLALNQGSFAEKFKVRAGGDWTVKIEKVKP